MTDKDSKESGLVDRALVKRAQSGDSRAFDLLVSKYQRQLRSVLSRYIKDEHEVQDVCQNSFIKAYKALPNFRGESTFYTWLYRIAVNTAKNHLVSSYNKVSSLNNSYDTDENSTNDWLEQIPDYETPETSLSNKQIIRVVKEAVEKLPEDLKKAIELREIEGLSYEEIALQMNCPVGTVRSRIFRAREVIADDLRPFLGTSSENRW